MRQRIRRFARAALWLALAGSLALNGFLYVQGRAYYRLHHEVRLDPLGLSYYIAAQDAATAESSPLPRVVFYGDSRAESWPFPDLSGFVFLNRGIGSQTTAQAALRLTSDLRRLKPQVVVVQVGINDLKTLPLFPERRAALTAACQGNIRQIVEDAVALDATVVLSTVFPAGRPSGLRWFSWSDQVPQMIVETNVFIRSLAGPNVIVLDADKVLADSTGRLQPVYATDLFHLNAAGYEALNVALADILVRWAQAGQ